MKQINCIWFISNSSDSVSLTFLLPEINFLQKTKIITSGYQESACVSQHVRTAIGDNTKNTYSAKTAKWAAVTRQGVFPLPPTTAPPSITWNGIPVFHTAPYLPQSGFKLQGFSFVIFFYHSGEHHCAAHIVLFTCIHTSHIIPFLYT